jgi:acyl-coenzyme A synthetase/AMP-(fatty) acid ligase
LSPTIARILLRYGTTWSRHDLASLRLAPRPASRDPQSWNWVFEKVSERGRS